METRQEGPKQGFRVEKFKVNKGESIDLNVKRKKEKKEKEKYK